MKITWDISSLPFGTGVSKYTKSLITTYISEFPKDEISLYGSSLRRKRILEEFGTGLEKEVIKKIYPFPPKLQSLLFNNLHLPIKPFIGSTQIFHSWEWYTPRTEQERLVTTIHDLTPIKFPEETKLEIIQNHQESLRWIKREASMIITVSEATKRDIIELLQVNPEKIRVIYEDIPTNSEVSVNQKDIKSVRSKYNIVKPFLLMVGTEKRKNIERAITAWESYSKDYQLVIVGKMTKNNSLREGIIYTDYVSDKDLAVLYFDAQCLVYPSLYEGFGLPILEAFSYQTPVVTSNVSSMPEIAGEAAVLVNPYEVDSIREGIETALNNSMSYIQRGLDRLGAFSWKKTAQQTREVYQKALEI